MINGLSLHIINAIGNKPIYNIILDGDKQSNHIKIRNETVYPLFILLFQIAWTIRQDRKEGFK